MVYSFFNFLNNCIPQYVVSVRTKNSFARYLNMYWFQCAWKTTFTAEVAFLVPEQERRNPLLLTNNITENQFRLIVQGENANHLNKSLALQVQTLIDRTLPRHAHDTVRGATSLAKFQNQVNTSKGKLLRHIMKGIDLVKAGKVMLVENWEQHGWVFITSEDQKSESRNDHDYSLNAASQNLLARLNIQAVKMFHDVVVQYLPVLEPDDGVYIVNIFLNICTCTSFVQKGQPYFCKHLHAVLATTHDCFDHLKLLELYFTAVPKIPPGLIRFFPTRNNIQGCNVFGSVKSLLQISHQATDLEKKHAVNGNILKLLHDPAKPAAPTFFPGRLPKRHPHRAGFRRKGGPMCNKNSNYELTFPEFNMSDPYQPRIKIPHNARERWGGRKRSSHKKRGLTTSKVTSDNAQILAHKLKKLAIARSNKKRK